ncbi:MAG: VWA domain-containing protein [Myxococcota bacterium]
MQGWKMTLGLAALAVGAALVAPRLFPMLGLAPVPTAEAASAAVEPTAPEPGVAEIPPPPPRTIDLVVALDTSGSMESLLDSTRARLWDIVNEVDRQDPDAILRVGLLTYGTPDYGADRHFVKVQMGLTEDLDAVYSKAWELRTNGGDEFVGAVIDHALAEMDWAPRDNSDNRRILFVAGNETAQLGPIDFRSAAARAVGANVIVNTLYAGDAAEGRTLHWDAVATAGNGRYLAIDARQSAVAVATPYDQQLEHLNRQLNNTYVQYNHEGQQKLRQILDNDQAAGSLGAGSLASRIGTKGSAKHRVESWDLVEGLSTGSVKLEDVDATALPSELQGLGDVALRAEVERKSAERAQAKAEIKAIQAKRSAYLQEEAKNSAGAGLDEAMSDVLADQL